jgi:uncharacterized protein (TIGR02996 family)
VFALEIVDHDRPVRRQMFNQPEVTIGQMAGADLVLPAPGISDRHARIVVKDGKYIVVDLKSELGTFVNNRRIPAPTVIRTGAVITIGRYTLTVDPVDVSAIRASSIAPIEAELRGAIAQRIDGGHMVYADWLEEQGEVARAEFLRIEERLLATPPGSTFDNLNQRRYVLAETIDVYWRVEVARPLIEATVTTALDACPRDWGSLERTERPDIRRCGTCQGSITYCTDIDVVRSHLSRGELVVLDAWMRRRRGDLAPYEVSALR